MGQNRYGTWNDAAMAALEKKYTKKEAAYNAKLAKRRNNLIEKLKALDLEAQEGLRKLQKEFQDSADALVTLHKQN